MQSHQDLVPLLSEFFGSSQFDLDGVFLAAGNTVEKATKCANKSFDSDTLLEKLKSLFQSFYRKSFAQKYSLNRKSFKR